ncbi:MAG: hypothetical protein ACT443_08665 [Gemmatimonadota bacterium]
MSPARLTRPNSTKGLPFGVNTIAESSASQLPVSTTVVSVTFGVPDT